MNVLSDLHDTLDAMAFPQLLSAFAFFAAYVLAVTGFLGDALRHRIRGLTVLAALQFVAFTEPWTHGVLLVALAIGAVGIFIALVALSSRLLGMTEVRGAALEPLPMPAAEAPAPARRVRRSAGSSPRAEAA